LDKIIIRHLNDVDEDDANALHQLLNTTRLSERKFSFMYYQIYIYYLNFCNHGSALEIQLHILMLYSGICNRMFNIIFHSQHVCCT